MNLIITPARLIAEVQREFNTEFPFLKLEFMQYAPSVPSGGLLKRLVSDKRKIGDVQKFITDGNVKIEEDMKVAELENILKDKFGLQIQVFRRSGNLWLETTMTDSWTLRQQNEHGQEISASPKNQLRNDDYDLCRDADH